MNSGSKSSSRWGSFFQQAVAGVESRLDVILADGDESLPAETRKSRANVPSEKGEPLGPLIYHTGSSKLLDLSTERIHNNRV